MDELLEGINHVRTNDLWCTPPFSTVTLDPSTIHPKPLLDILVPASTNNQSNLPPSAATSRISSETVRQTTISRGPREQHPSALADPSKDFPRLFKVYPCPAAAACYEAGVHNDCFYYHAVETDRRRAAVGSYRPYMCRFVGEASGCRKGDRCPFAHNDFERRYHPERFGKETCRDFLRNDCPRRFCTFRHEVSGKVESAINAIDSMTDKEMLQLVLKLSDARGRALSEKLARRFGYGKKNSGWCLVGFDLYNGEEQKANFLSDGVEEIKRRLREAGEGKWASILKTLSLRDMMSGVRKVTEEIRERIYKNGKYHSEMGFETQRLIRVVFSNANWSCHSHEGDNPFVVTPENQIEAVTALGRLVEKFLFVPDNKNNFQGSGIPLQQNAPSMHSHSFHFKHGSQSNNAMFDVGRLTSASYGTQQIGVGMSPWRKSNNCKLEN